MEFLREKFNLTKRKCVFCGAKQMQNSSLNVLEKIVLATKRGFKTIYACPYCIKKILGKAVEGKFKFKNEYKAFK